MKSLRTILCVAITSFLLYSCSSNNVHEHKKWDKYFGGKDLSGSFLLHNTVLNTFNVFNLPGTQVRQVPGPVFDIMNVMTALETGAAGDTTMVLTDSLGRPVKGVDSSLTMGQAFREASQPYFSELARRIGRFKMQYWLDSVKYGNGVIGAYVDSFWVNNTLKISPDEMMGFMQELYSGKLPFQTRTQRLGKALLLRETNVLYKLYYAEGYSVAASQKLGWIAGWIEENAHPHFFVLQVASRDTSRELRSVCHATLHDILEEEGYFKQR